MQKKLLSLLMVLACLMTSFVAFADGETVTEEDIKKLPAPAEGTGLIEVSDVSGDAEHGYTFVEDSEGNVILHNNLEDAYKIIVYSPSDNLFWYTHVDTVECEGAPGDKPISVKVDEFVSSPDFVSAVTDANPCEFGYQFQVITGNTYVIYLKDDATSLADAVFACRTEDLLNHVEDFTAKLPKYDGQHASVSVELVEKLYSGSKVVGATYNFNYNLPGYNKNGYLYEEFGSSVIITDVNCGVKCPENSKSGSVKFTVDNIRNKTYEAYIITNVGHEYSTSFVVDFASGDNRDPANFPQDEPVVTFVGLPSDAENGRREVLPVVVNVNVPVTLMWNGTQVTNGVSDSINISIVENGIYYYTATTEAGKTTTGYIEIHCFDTSWTPPENAELIVSAGGLVQTGYEVQETNSYYWVLVIIAVVCAAVGVVIIKRKGEKKA